jgi:hypothetical protein
MRYTRFFAHWLRQAGTHPEARDIASRAREWFMEEAVRATILVPLDRIVGSREEQEETIRITIR